MYIELFVIDNVIMNYIMLRMACAVRCCRVGVWRLAGMALLLALYALLAIQNALLMLLPFKLAAGLALALALPARSLTGYALNVLALFLAAFVAGGLTVCVALCAGGMRGGVAFFALPVRAALYSIALACCLPRVLRALFFKRVRSGACLVRIAALGRVYVLEGLIDTGSMLSEPISGLPVVVADCAQLGPHAHIPVPARTVQGETLLYAFKPDGLTLDGYPSDALVAIAPGALKGAGALIPQAALAIETSGGKTYA